MRELSLSTYSGLVDALYRAGLDPREWPHFLSALSDAFGGAVWVALHRHDRRTNTSLCFLTCKYDPAFIAAYEKEYGEINPWRAAAQRDTVGRAQPSEALVDPDLLRKTRFYNEWIRPQEDIGTGAGMTLERDPRHFARLSCNIRYRDGERIQPQLIAILNLLAPHFQRALVVSRHLAADAAMGVMETMPAAVYLLDARRRVRRANRLGEAVRKEERLLHYDRAGRLIIADPDADRALARAISAIDRRDHLDLRGALVIRDPAGGSPAEATVTPFPSSPAPLADPFDRIEEDAPVALLCVALPRTASVPRQGDLAQRFGLTPAEAAVAVALYEGTTLKRYAANRGVSIETVRSQVKAVLRKTAAGRQSRLVALLAGAGMPAEDDARAN